MKHLTKAWLYVLISCVLAATAYAQDAEPE